MQYRHSFHAGNFADLHKHIALLALIRALQNKAKGFLLLDTHAGAGDYDLGSAEARQSGEADGGIAALERALTPSANNCHPAIRAYIDVVHHIRRTLGKERRYYPGSPLLAAAQLRSVDQLICVEVHAQTARALQRSFEQAAAALTTTPRIVTGDGYQELKSQLPPRLRRGLVLIDPPYESADEEAQIADALLAGLERFETGVFALWFPIKKQHETDLWLARIMRGIARPTLTMQLCLRTPDNAAGLNGSGLLVINPPWKFDTEAAQWQQELHDMLGGGASSKLDWLINE
jgi:23S rRNA (adenine2030-N6)-methyltransferase